MIRLIFSGSGRISLRCYVGLGVFCFIWNVAPRACAATPDSLKTEAGGRLTTNFGAIVNEVQGDDSARIVLRSVTLRGHVRTRERIIRREMDLRVGDTLRLGKLRDRLIWDQRKISNTNLFVTVDVVARPGVDSLAEPRPVEVEIVMKERWYIFPSIVFELADRNFNEWWYDRNRDLNRVNYGGRLDWRNLTGRNDKLTAVAQFGFTRRLLFSYARPYIDRAQRTGLVIDLATATNVETFYRTDADKWVFVRGQPGDILRDRLNVGLTITNRDGFYRFHNAELRYTRTTIGDTVARLNPDYFGSGTDGAVQTRQQFWSLGYQFTYDRRDNVAYPLQGIVVRANAVKLGLLPNDDINLLDVQASVSQFWALGGRWYANGSVRGRTLLGGRIPYANLRGLGIGADFVRGYELFIIDGTRYGLLRSNLRYQLINTRRQFRWIPLRQFNTVPLAAYVSGFVDAGYVYSPVAADYNSRLANRPLVGTGLSLDLVTFYNVVLRFSGTLNVQGQRGFFVNILRDF